MEYKKSIHFKIGKISTIPMNWEEAKKFAEKQRMQLPTRIEALCLLEMNLDLPERFWTCEPDIVNKVWYIYNSGTILSVNKNFERPVVLILPLN